MTEIFLTLVNMSISAGWIVLILLLLRPILKKAPKWISVLLWSIVAARLICPFSIESALSLIPSAQTINPKVALNPPIIDSGVPIIDGIVNPIIGDATIPFQTEKNLNLFQFIMPYLAGLWLVGMIGLFIYTSISYIRLKKKIGTAVLLYDNVFQSESVVSPFVLGIIKPKIYLPFHMNELDMSHVIAHEKAHIKRCDHLWKPLGFLLLTFHWFNPLMWLGYILLCRDIELACDEKVIKKLDTKQKADYSQALLTCSVNRKLIAACPLAFGEVGIKDRVKSVLNYKKPTFWIILFALLAGILVAICFLTNPKTSLNDELAVFLDSRIAEHHQSKDHFDRFSTVDYDVLHVDQSLDKTTVYLWVFYQEYSFSEGLVKAESGVHVPTVISARQTGEHGHYKLEEYWEPRDGAYYDEDIKNKFPWYLHEKALHSQQNTNELKEMGLEEAKEYFLFSSQEDGVDSPTFPITFDSIEHLKEKFPTYFGLSTAKGLEVYVWQMGEGLYSCGLLPGRNLSYSKEELWNLHKSPTSMAEMANIVASYIRSGDITREEVTLHAISMPFSSYAYTIDDAYIQNLNNLFWTYTNSLLQETPESEDEWIRPPTKTYFPDADKHRFYKMEIQTYVVENNTVYGCTVYHRLFKHCLDCNEVVEATEHYPCQTNDRNCQGGCLDGMKK